MTELAAVLDAPRPACAWTVADVTRDTGWIHRLDADQAQALIAAVRAARVEGKSLLDYRRADFPFGRALRTLADAFAQVRDGRGMALVKGLPREGVAPHEFELMTWAIGLHFGVARPQDRTSSYINKVQDVGGVYRSPTGRGYSSNAQLDFHVDGADVVLLSCYNQAPVGGMSMCTSSTSAFLAVAEERPELAQALMTPYPFSRNGEQPAGEPGWVSAPLFGIEGGRISGAWNRNRLINAIAIEGVPPLSGLQYEAVGYLDAVVRRPDLMYRMYLEPGDLQLLGNQTMLHSRTTFQDHPEPERKRTLYRLWIATPDSRPLPAGFEWYYGTREPGTVRGTNRGQRYDDACRRFDEAQSRELGMRIVRDVRAA